MTKKTLPNDKWLREHGMSGLVEAKRKRPELFAHIGQGPAAPKSKPDFIPPEVAYQRYLQYGPADVAGLFAAISWGEWDIRRTPKPKGRARTKAQQQRLCKSLRNKGAA